MRDKIQFSILPVICSYALEHWSDHMLAMESILLDSHVWCMEAKHSQLNMKLLSSKRQCCIK